MNPIGEIRRDAIYTKEAVQQITGLGRTALSAMRRSGLPVRYVAGRWFISGSALIDFIEREGKPEK
jgi:hypothetical protein